MSLMCLAKYPDVFHAAVGGAPVTEWEGYDTGYVRRGAAVRARAPRHPRHPRSPPPPPPQTERYMSTPAANPEGYREASVLTHAARIRGAVLLVHGLLDENVLARHTMRLVGALTAADVPYDLVVMPEERHVPRAPQTKAYVEARIAAFFEKNVRGRA